MNYQFARDLPIPIMIVYLPTGKLLHLNPAAMAEWGYSAHGVLRLRLVDITAPVDEADRKTQETFLSSRGGSVFHFSADVSGPGHEQRRYRFAARAGVEEEPEVGVLTALDVSEQEAIARASAENARRLRALVESNFDAYYDWHIRAGYHEWSHQMDALLGLEDGSFPNTLDAWVERLHPSERHRVIRKLNESVESGSHYHDEYLLRREDGEYRFVADRGVLLFDEQGVATDLVGVIRDVTQESAARAALEESEELYRSLFQSTTNPALRTDDDGNCLDANQAAITFLGVDSGRALEDERGRLLWRRGDPDPKTDVPGPQEHQGGHGGAHPRRG